MLTVTTAALDRLSQKLAHKNAHQGQALRFTQRTGGWRLRLDHPQPEDTQFKHDGRSVLLLDPSVSEAMRNKKLDVTSTDLGARLKLHAHNRE